MNWHVGCFVMTWMCKVTNKIHVPTLETLHVMSTCRLFYFNLWFEIRDLICWFSFVFKIFWLPKYFISKSIQLNFFKNIHFHILYVHAIIFFFGIILNSSDHPNWLGPSIQYQKHAIGMNYTSGQFKSNGESQLRVRR